MLRCIRRVEFCKIYSKYCNSVLSEVLSVVWNCVMQTFNLLLFLKYTKMISSSRLQKFSLLTKCEVDGKHISSHFLLFNRNDTVDHRKLHLLIVTFYLPPINYWVFFVYFLVCVNYLFRCMEFFDKLLAVFFH